MCCLEFHVWNLKFYAWKFVQLEWKLAFYIRKLYLQEFHLVAIVWSQVLSIYNLRLKAWNIPNMGETWHSRYWTLMWVIAVGFLRQGTFTPRHGTLNTHMYSQYPNMNFALKTGKIAFCMQNFNHQTWNVTLQTWKLEPHIWTINH